MGEIYRFSFSKEITNKQIAHRLFLAAVNTENVFGEAAMRLDASFSFNKKSRVCQIDRGTEVGQHIAKLFIAYISKEFGDGSYSIKRVQGNIATTPSKSEVA